MTKSGKKTDVHVIEARWQQTSDEPHLQGQIDLLQQEDRKK
jgi:hypothetical protein